jgi:hypothetical protein
MPYDEIAEAAKHLAANKQTNGFKIDSDGLYIESRILKAMLKEVTNILFAGKRWGPTKKGPKSFLAERVFVSPSHVGLGIKEPSGIELFIGHTNGPQGRMSNLTYYEYAEQPVLQFTIRVAEDAVPLDAWPELWVLAQDNGLGALRSQGHGCFDVNCWERIES